tara:strand:+ start:2432 stop:3058 length:627 start_codon:yes stop_codon:yes gene_type:complete
MLRKIKLYGNLAEFCGGQNEFEAVANTTADAIKFLAVNFQGLDKHMSEQFYQVKLGNTPLDYEELIYPAGYEEIKIIPVVSGSGNIGKILAGVALIAIGFGFAGGFAGKIGFGEFLKAPLFNATTGALSWTSLAGKLGILLVLNGLAGLLTPTPEIDDSEGDPRNSFSFSGIQNTARAGTVIPVIYGDVITGSIPVSARVVTEDSETD